MNASAPRAAFAAALAAALAPSCIVHSGSRFGYGSGHQAARQESHALGIQPGELLRVEIPNGDVRVHAGEGEPSLSARITAWADDDAAAKEVVERTVIEITGTPDGPKVALQRGDPGQTRDLERFTANADLEIRIPPGVRLDIKTGSGDIDAEGPLASSRVQSSYGSIRVESVDGDLEASSSSGDVSVSHVHGERIVALSGYGDVRVSACEATKVGARSSSGDLRIEDVRAERVELASGYGDVEIHHVEGSVDAKLSSGDVEARDLVGAQLTLATSYGRARVTSTEGALSVSSSSGDVRVAGHEGPVEARSGYGSVDVSGVLSTVAVASSSGDVSVRAQRGSATEGAWKIASSYGRATLAVPPDLAFDLDARTHYGKVRLGMPVEIAPGTHERDTQAYEGKVNGGGGRIEILCRSGDVVLETTGP